MPLPGLALIGGFITGEIRQAKRSQKARSSLPWQMGVEITQSVSVGPSAGDEKAQAETSTAIAPGVSIAASLLLMIRAFQIIVGQHMPMFPRRIAVRPLLRNIILLLAPVPLSNVVAARVIALSSLADLEEDGCYSRIALRASVIVLAVELAAVWEATLGVKWILASGGSLRRLVLRLVRPSL